MAGGSGRGKSATCKEIRAFYNLCIKEIRGARVDLYYGILQDQYIIRNPLINNNHDTLLNTEDIAEF